MSVFLAATTLCPSCGSENPFEAAMSVNADRKPELAEAIRSGDFQVSACRACAVTFRPPPHLTYLHQASNQWIAAYPEQDLARWPEREEEARKAFENSLGSGAPRAARKLGSSLKPRVTFGWAALREKLDIAAAGLDDLWVEATKAALLATADGAPLGPQNTLRFVGMEEDELVFAFLENEERVISGVRLGRPAYDELKAHPEDWQGVLSHFDGTLYVDLDRVFLERPTEAHA